MKEKSPALPLAYGQKTESFMVVNILAQESEKNNRIPDKKRRFRYRVIHKGIGKGIGSTHINSSKFSNSTFYKRLFKIELKR